MRNSLAVNSRKRKSREVARRSSEAKAFPQSAKYLEAVCDSTLTDHLAAEWILIRASSRSNNRANTTRRKRCVTRARAKRRDGTHKTEINIVVIRWANIYFVLN